VAIGFIASKIFHVRSLSTIGKSNSDRRAPSGFWFSRLNFPESNPPASGLQTSKPVFSASNSGMISRSRSTDGFPETFAAAECHRPEAQSRNQQTRVAERFVFHGSR
jgi:hypothetical protein